MVGALSAFDFACAAPRVTWPRSACALRPDSEGAELQIYENGQFVTGQWCETRALALQADAIRDALQATGWT